MHRAAALLVLTLALAGCSAAPPQAAQTQSNAAGPQLALSEFRQENPACDDTTHFRVTLRNAGSVAAQAVQLAASTSGRGTDAALELGDVAAGASMVVEASVVVADTCGVEDRYPVTLTAKPANGPPATLRVEIST